MKLEKDNKNMQRSYALLECIFEIMIMLNPLSVFEDRGMEGRHKVRKRD